MSRFQCLENMITILHRNNENPSSLPLHSSPLSPCSSSILNCLEEIVSPPNLGCSSFTCDIENRIKLYEQMKDRLISHDKDLMKIYRRCTQRNLEDKKVPPNSHLVQPTITDPRFLLSLLCLNIGYLLELLRDEEMEISEERGCRSSLCSKILQIYREAIVWYPKSIEGNYSFGQYLKYSVSNQQELDLVQEFWEKGLSAVTASLSSTGSQSCNCQLCSTHYQRFQDQITRRSQDASHKLKSALILHYCQSGRMDLATPHLISGRYLLVLSQEILHYPFAVADTHLQQKSLCSNAMGVDNVLPLQYLRRLQFIFRPHSPFWLEHHYDFFSNASRTVGYFSYLYHFRDHPAPTNFIEQVIQRIYQTVVHKFPEVENDATVGEYDRTCVSLFSYFPHSVS